MTRPDPSDVGSGDPPAEDILDPLVFAAAAMEAIAARLDGATGGEGAQWEGVGDEAASVAAAAERMRAGAGDGDADAGDLVRAWDRDHRAQARDAAEALLGSRLARGLVADLGDALVAAADTASAPVGDDGADALRARLAGLDAPLGGPAAEVLAAATADPRTRDRLALYSRRLLGEALVLVDALLAAHPATAAAIDGGAAGDGGRRALLQSVKSGHGRRAGSVGL